MNVEIAGVMVEVRYTIQEGGQTFFYGEWDLLPTALIHAFKSKIYFDDMAIPPGPVFIKLEEHSFVFGVFLFMDGKLVAKLYANGTEVWS